jgi:glycosyltransferase involved in cell wall biosynthesis
VIADHHSDLIFPDVRSKFYWKLKQQAAIRQADLIATVSEYSKQEIVQYFKIPESRIRIISEAARPVFKVLSTNNGYVSTLAKYGLQPDMRFLLYVGGISPHKNLNTLIDAFKKMVEDGKAGDLKLVLVGDYADDPFFSAYPKLRKQVQGSGLADRILFTGFVPDGDLAYLYNAAALLVFPSLEEGFGLPAIEAMACGTAVAASSTSSLPEVIGSAGAYFDPRNVANMCDVIIGVLSDEPQRQRMKASGLERSRHFGWKRAAEETLAIFTELAAK